MNIEVIIIIVLAALLALEKLFYHLKERRYLEELEKWAQKVMTKTYEGYSDFLITQQKLKLEMERAKTKKEGKAKKVKEPPDSHIGSF